MGKVRVSVVIHAPLEQVYEMATDLDIYPQLMPTCKRLEVLESSDDGCRKKVRWHAEARLLAARRDMSWVQHDCWDPETHTCTITLDPDEPGRYKSLNGAWQFNPHPRGTELIVDLDFQLQHPAMTPTLHRFLDKVMEKNNRALLHGMKRRAENQAARCQGY